MCLFCPCWYLRFFSSILALSSLMMICLGVVFFVFILFRIHCVYKKWKLKSLSGVQLFATPMDYTPPSGSSVLRILQVRILEWVAIPFSRGSSWPRGRTWVSCTAGRFFTLWTTREAIHSHPINIPHKTILLGCRCHGYKDSCLFGWSQSSTNACLLDIMSAST